MSDGIVTPKVLSIIRDTGQSKSKARKTMDHLKKVEPAFYRYIEDKVREMVHELHETGIPPDPQWTRNIASKLQQAFIEAYMAHDIGHNLLWNKDLGLTMDGAGARIDPDAIYDKWLSGHMADKFYNYTTPKGKNEEAVVMRTAKANHKKFIEKREETAKKAKILNKVQEKTGSKIDQDTKNDRYSGKGGMFGFIRDPEM